MDITREYNPNDTARYQKRHDCPKVRTLQKKTQATKDRGDE
jgi:hypothetical protein